MPQPPLCELADYPAWLAFVRDYPHLTQYAAATKAVKKFGGSQSTWQTRVKTIRQHIAEEKMKATKLQLRHKEQDRQFVEAVLGRDYPYTLPKKQFAKTIDPDKTIVVSDPHEPYSVSEVWKEVFDKHRNAAHIHINGDLADFYSRSHFRKTEGDEWFAKEIQAVFARMEWLATHFQRVTIIRGNHDNRAQKKIADELTSDMLWMVDDDILGRCAAFFDNVTIVGQRLQGDAGYTDIDFIWQYKDVVFTHIERSQAQSSGLAESIGKIIGQWAGMFGLSGYRWIVQGHNHRNDQIDLGWGYGFIIPCAAHPLSRGMKYVLSPAMKGRPPKIGYMILHFKDGHAQYNESRVIEVGYKLTAITRN